MNKENLTHRKNNKIIKNPRRIRENPSPTRMTSSKRQDSIGYHQRNENGSGCEFRSDRNDYPVKLQYQQIKTSARSQDSLLLP